MCPVVVLVTLVYRYMSSYLNMCSTIMYWTQAMSFTIPLPPLLFSQIPLFDRREMKKLKTFMKVFFFWRESFNL